MILKRLSMAMTFSQDTRSLEISRFLAVSLADNGFFLLRFFGIAVLACLLWRAPRLVDSDSSPHPIALQHLVSSDRVGTPERCSANRDPEASVQRIGRRVRKSSTADALG
jgi:hypothetical protein